MNISWGPPKYVGTQLSFAGVHSELWGDVRTTRYAGVHNELCGGEGCLQNELRESYFERAMGVYS